MSFDRSCDVTYGGDAIGGDAVQKYGISLISKPHSSQIAWLSRKRPIATRTQWTKVPRATPRALS